ncbi:MAG: RsbRD N-terminal domain-containing protein [Proteobacteria bacterium]|nr:RsbRD N-terminal domain-containing protein [Pseudomonadota bacterium]
MNGFRGVALRFGGNDTHSILIAGYLTGEGALMGLEKILGLKQSEITKAWFDQVVKTYHGDSSHFLLDVKDPFSNPVGATTFKALGEVFEALISGKTRSEIIPLLDPPIRIRAVQEFSPSQAVSFVFFLKNVVRHCLEKEIKNTEISEKELSNFDDKVDGLSLIAFDIYMGCREQIFKFRAEHVKSRTLKLLEKADILCEVPEVGTEIIPHNVYKNGGFENT